MWFKDVQKLRREIDLMGLIKIKKSEWLNGVWKVKKKQIDLEAQEIRVLIGIMEVKKFKKDDWLMRIWISNGADLINWSHVI